MLARVIVNWDALVEAWDTGLETWFDLETGQLSEVEREGAVLVCQSPYPRDHHRMGRLRRRRMQALRLGDLDARRHLLRVLDDFDSQEHHDALEALLGTRSSAAYRDRTRDVIDRYHRQLRAPPALIPDEAAKTIAWKMSGIRLSAFDLALERHWPDEPKLDLEDQLSSRSEQWAWLQTLPIEIENEPPFAEEVRTWRKVEWHFLEDHVSALVLRLERALALEQPPPKLAPGTLDLTALETIARAAGRELPRAVSQLYAWHASSDGDIAPVAYGYRLMPMSEAIERRDATLAHEDSGWSAAWFPLFADPSGNYVVLDLEGRHTGVSGQMLAVWHDDPEASVIAYDLAAWLETLVVMFESGRTAVDERGFGAGYLEWGETHLRLFAVEPAYFRRAPP